MGHLLVLPGTSPPESGQRPLTPLEEAAYRYEQVCRIIETAQVNSISREALSRYRDRLMEEMQEIARGDEAHRPEELIRAVMAWVRRMYAHIVPDRVERTPTGERST